MSIEKQKLYNVIDTLSDEFLNKVLGYIEYLKFTDIAKNASENLIIKDNDKGFKD